MALLAQGLASLGAGIVEFRSLSNDDRAGTDNENFQERTLKTAFSRGGVALLEGSFTLRAECTDFG